MKIGLVCPYNIWGGGGVQECVLALRSELSSRGHDVKIITPMPRGFKGKIAPYIITAGMSANVKAFFNTQSQISASVDTDRIHDMLKAENFDVIHFHEPWVPIVSRQILARSNSANVATSHALIPDNLTSKAIVNLSNSYTRGLLKHIHAFSAVSPSAAKYIMKFTDRKIHIVPNGIDLGKYTPDPNGSHKHKTILYIGRLEKRKGIGYLLEAFALLRSNNPKLKLIIAGDGPLKSKLESWVKDYGVPGVEFLGYVSEKKKHQLFNKADLFCSPALYGESFGIVLLEAMAMGVVTVAGNNPGYSGVMKGKGKNSLVDPTDVTTFAAKLENMLFDEERRLEWLKWSSEYVKQFDYSRVVDQYEALYQTALKQKKSRDIHTKR